ncbi:hypothetical protein B0H10DRAFT_1919017 [Mycena sp. CBHHK59/15]|nr:hypothetical protein B0H10DRAFT_1919017 [Mycena sp. CBHHK59/15]
MRLCTLITASSLLVSSVSAAVSATSAQTQALTLARGITKDNCYGAPIPPWEEGCHPGWYYGPPDLAPAGLACLVDGVVCLILELLGLCPKVPLPPPPPPPPVGPAPPPPPPAPYMYQWTNLACAAESWPPQNYLTYGIVNTTSECAAMCNQVSKCIFFNTYHDNNALSKKNSPYLTCSLFAVVLTSINATNCGGQQQNPAPSDVTVISDSYGFSKVVAKS